MIFLQFPNFNIYSTPLLVLAIQGLLFAALLFIRFGKKRSISDFFLGLILLITCWHQTTYTIGFMGWYDSNPNTKINYFLINQSMALAPLLYFYVKSITVPHFRFRLKDYLHFIPALLFVLYKIGIYLYDASQPGFAETQNGYMLVNFDWKYVSPFITIFQNFQMLLYIAFTMQMYFIYRNKIRHIFSNTFLLELNWMRNFLLIYAFLFVYSIIQLVIEISITDLSWTQEWWYFFFSCLAIIYIGIKGYFTNTNKLNELDLDQSNVLQITNYSDQIIASTSSDPVPTKALSNELTQLKQQVKTYMFTERPYLNPDLNLIQLAKSLNMNRGQLSEVINLGFGQNFNDFINQYRVNAVKEMLDAGKQEQLSLLGIAYDCGFNSKATFNRVFKKFVGSSPSQYLKEI